MKKNPRTSSSRTSTPTSPDEKSVVRSRSPSTGTDDVLPGTPNWTKSKRDLPAPFTTSQDVPQDDPAPFTASQDVPQDDPPTPPLALMLRALAHGLENSRLINLETAFPGQSAKFRRPSSGSHPAWRMEREQYRAMLDVAGMLPAVITDRPLDIPGVAAQLKVTESVDDAIALAALLDYTTTAAPARSSPTSQSW
jgi:hypothetical protein